MIPLPKAVRELVQHNSHTGLHPGLALDKYLDSWHQNTDTKHQEKVQKPTLEQVIKNSQSAGLDYQALLDRRDKALASVGGRVWRCRATGPLTLHLARASALENAGICLHPLYGFTYLPGSGLKGLARAYAETVWLKGQADQAKAWRLIEAVFGWAPGSDKGKSYKPADAPKHGKKDNAAAGTIVFHDAWPCNWPKLVLDIVNNHHQRYYKGEDEPGDWENPVPVYFLAVPAGQEFSFSLSKRKPEVGDDLLELAEEWLNGGLAHLGVGAKTNAGYGTMQPLQKEAPKLPSASLATFEATLELVTPAFLAGASQKAEDCDLRPATLRGVLRWWWRTLYADKLDVQTLRSLEAAIWGDTKAGGAVRIEVKRINPTDAVLYDKKSIISSSEAYKISDYGIKNCNPKKTTMGLWYLSYGMDEEVKVNDNKQSKKRHYLEPGSTWQVKIIARDAAFFFDRNKITVGDKGENKKAITAIEIREQAVNALHLLCTYGGIGSKSRKGFGSLRLTNLKSDKKISEIADDAKRFLRTHDIHTLDKHKITSPALTCALKPVEVHFNWTDYWLVLDQVGFAYQTYAQGKKHNLEKRALGMPRKIGRPTTGNFNPKDGEFGKIYQEAKRQNQEGNLRFASPIHFHISKSDGEGYTVRLLAFPSEYLPSLQESRSLLSDAVVKIYEDLKRRSKLDCPKIRNSSVSAQADTRLRPAANAPRTGEVVKAVLVEDPKGKGRRYAKDVEHGLIGHIENSNDVPDEKKVGDSVELIVKTVTVHGEIHFRWPTVAAQQRPSQPQRHSPGPAGPQHKHGSTKKRR